MARAVSVHEKGVVERFLRRDPVGHLLALADLDDGYWPYTTWYAWE
jgi:hypothetical protein